MTLLSEDLRARASSVRRGRNEWWRHINCRKDYMHLLNAELQEDMVDMLVVLCVGDM